MKNPRIRQIRKTKIYVLSSPNTKKALPSRPLTAFPIIQRRMSTP